jgi:hypothetical protein
LKERLDEVSSSLRDATARLDTVTDERDQLQFQLTRLDEKLIRKETCDPTHVKVSTSLLEWYRTS